MTFQDNDMTGYGQRKVRITTWNGKLLKKDFLGFNGYANGHVVNGIRSECRRSRAQKLLIANTTIEILLGISHGGKKRHTRYMPSIICR